MFLVLTVPISGLLCIPWGISYRNSMPRKNFPHIMLYFVLSQAALQHPLQLSYLKQSHYSLPLSLLPGRNEACANYEQASSPTNAAHFLALQQHSRKQSAPEWQAGEDDLRFRRWHLLLALRKPRLPGRVTPGCADHRREGMQAIGIAASPVSAGRRPARPVPLQTRRAPAKRPGWRSPPRGSSASHERPPADAGHPSVTCVTVLTNELLLSTAPFVTTETRHGGAAQVPGWLPARPATPPR